jgi:hypothetical protein
MSTATSEIIYADKWLTLHSDETLTIHKYYFPSPTRTLQISHIENIATPFALQLGRWEFKKWGIGFTWIMWAMDWSRETFSVQGPSAEIKRRNLVIQTREGVLFRIGVTCEDIDRFLGEMEKMGVKVLREPEGGLHAD